MTEIDKGHTNSTKVQLYVNKFYVGKIKRICGKTKVLTIMANW